MSSGTEASGRSPYRQELRGETSWLASGQLLYLLRKTVNMETQHVQQFSISTVTLRPTQLCLGVFPMHL